MYLAVSAIGVRFGINKKWEEINLSDWKVIELFATFRRAQIKLSVASDPAPQYITLDNLRVYYSTYPNSLAELLIYLGDRALATTTEPIVLNKRTAQFKDAFKAGFTVTPVTHANLDNVSIPAEEKTDIRLTREKPATDYMNLFKHCLVSINGFYHLTDTDGAKGVIVSDAMKSLRRSGQNQIGLYSFNNVGSLEIVPINPTMVQHSLPGEVKLTLPQDLTGKTVMLVLGGYLHTVDPFMFKRIGNATYKLDFNNLPMLERFFESRKYLDFSGLPLETTPMNLNQISVADLTNDAFIMAYLQMSQTFFVVLDAPEVFTQKQFIKRSGLPDMYIAYSEPFYPLVTELGRHPEYWYVHEDGQYSVTVYDNVIGNRAFNTVNANKLMSVDGSNESTNAGRISAAYFLEIGRDV